MGLVVGRVSVPSCLFSGKWGMKKTLLCLNRFLPLHQKGRGGHLLAELSRTTLAVFSRFVVQMKQGGRQHPTWRLSDKAVLWPLRKGVPAPISSSGTVVSGLLCSRAQRERLGSLSMWWVAAANVSGELCRRYWTSASRSTQRNLHAALGMDLM